MISLICPSYNRPDGFKKMVNSAYATAVGPIEVVLGLQEDDPSLKQYYPFKPDCLFKQKERLPVLYNKLAEKSLGDILMIAADDMHFETKGWDERFMKAMPDDGIAMFGFSDGRDGGHPHPAITRKWYETLGYLSRPEFNHFYTDTWVAKLAEKIDRLIYFKDIVMPHDKTLRGDKASPTRQGSSSGKDGAIWNRLQKEFEADAKKLMGVMDGVHNT